MDIRKSLINNNKELLEFTQTKQYIMSRKIMKLRYEISFSEKKMAEVLELSLGK